MKTLECHRPGVFSQPPADQTGPLACSCTAPDLTMVFKCLKDYFLKNAFFKQGYATATVCRWPQSLQYLLVLYINSLPTSAKSNTVIVDPGVMSFNLALHSIMTLNMLLLQ